MKIVLSILFICFLFIIPTFGEKLSFSVSKTHIASTEHSLASIVRNSEYTREPLKKPILASIEHLSSIGQNVPSITPVPTPPPDDIFKTLCEKAAKEVEANRIILDAQKQYIETLEKKDKASQDIIVAQQALSERLQQTLDKSQKVNDKADEIIKKKDEEISNFKKEVEILQRGKCGFKCQAIRVMVGIGMGAILVGL